MSLFRTTMLLIYSLAALHFHAAPAWPSKTPERSIRGPSAICDVALSHVAPSSPVGGVTIEEPLSMRMESIIPVIQKFKEVEILSGGRFKEERNVPLRDTAEAEGFRLFDALTKKEKLALFKALAHHSEYRARLIQHVDIKDGDSLIKYIVRAYLVHQSQVRNGASSIDELYENLLLVISDTEIYPGERCNLMESLFLNNEIDSIANPHAAKYRPQLSTRIPDPIKDTMIRLIQDSSAFIRLPYSAEDARQLLYGTSAAPQLPNIP